jgi:hypothetical protein
VASDRWSVASIKSVIAFLGLFSTISSPATASMYSNRFAEFGKKCGILAEQKTRVFAAIDGKHWKEYSSQEDIPEPKGEWAEGALVVRSAQATAADVEGEGQDFSDSSVYCFDARGELTQVERTFTTVWGWGYSEEDSFKDGALASHQEHYFDTAKGDFDSTKTPTIARPAGADDVREAMRLKLYKTVEELPFFKLMRRHQRR